MASPQEIRETLDDLYTEAEEVVEGTRNLKELEEILGSDLYEKIRILGEKRHAARGIALTLFTYKAVEPDQDIRSHMSEHPDGFNARTIDNAATVPFLTARSLHHNVESHWMTRVFANVGPFRKGMEIKTQPKLLGPLLAETVVTIEERDEEVAEAAARALIVGLIEGRNKGKVALARPKTWTIDQIVELLRAHVSRKYEKGAPRLPQLAVYAAYQCMVPAMQRYQGCELAPLLPMKAADRKAKTVGDVVVLQNEVPFEGVEVKHGAEIVTSHIAEAIAKLETAEARRYFILSTAGISPRDKAELADLAAKFRKSNGCEIITDGVLPSIRYYLRLLDDPVEFVNRYAKLVEEDKDLGYEHRIAWNELCEARS
jgi:DNA (cytosine-5)-methyltransferase 1